MYLHHTHKELFLLCTHRTCSHIHIQIYPFEEKNNKTFIHIHKSARVNDNWFSRCLELLNCVGIWHRSWLFFCTICDILTQLTVTSSVPGAISSSGKNSDNAYFLIIFTVCLSLQLFGPHGYSLPYQFAPSSIGIIS